MSRPGSYWFNISRSMIMRYYEIKPGSSKQEKMWVKAIDETIKEYEAAENGDYKVRAVQLVLLDHSHDFERAASELNYSWRTIQDWVNAFIRRVGKRAGY